MEKPGSANAADKLVLIVDDDKDIRDLLDIIVKKEGFRAVTAQDGEEAQEKARALLPDLILLDLMLPKFGGFELLHALQTDETAKIPIVVMTGRQFDDSTADMIRRESNVRDFIAKPIKTERLISRIHELLNTRPQAN